MKTNAQMGVIANIIVGIVGAGIGGWLAVPPPHALGVSRRDGDFLLEARQWLPQPLEDVFPFFAEAGNLDALTPPWLHFRILTPLPIEMRPGALIDYRLRLRGIPIRWRSEITEYDPPRRFVDVQRRGPYRLWRHEHVFSRVDEGTLVEDRVRYRVWGGALVNALLVRPDLERVFRHRQHQLGARLGSLRPDGAASSNA